MDLIFPGIRKLVWLFGLILIFTGSSLLAYLRTNKGRNKTEQITKAKCEPLKYGHLYLERNEEISEENKSPNHEDLFEELVDFILSFNNEYGYSIPPEPELLVERIEVEDTDRMENEIVIVFSDLVPWKVINTQKSRTRMSISNLETEIQEYREKSIKKN